MFCVLLQKNETFSRSFTFFAKEHCVLCVLFCSLEKNRKERNVLLGLIKVAKNSKKEQKKKLRSLKERNVLNGKEHGA